MGTTLTGTTPQDTYDSLIKVTDNGPLSATAKYLSDGLGNDSALALSTGNIGIGTTAPSVKLDIVGSIRIDEAGSSTDVLTLRSSFAGVGPAVNVTTSSPLLLMTANTERMRITSAGAVQIKGASTTTGHQAAIENTETLFTLYGSIFGGTGKGIAFWPTGAAEGMRLTTNGLTFNGDTAAANALDDYEEGTWTIGVAFGGASVGVTTSANTGTYTKIGRQVTVNGYIELTSKGSSTGNARITGLPFSIPNLTQNYATAGLYLGQTTFTNQFMGYGVVNTTTIQLDEVTILGAITPLENGDFANNSVIMVNFTYFV